MKTTMKTTKKRVYATPEIQVVNLDNEISLQLESDPPVKGDDEVYNSPYYFNNDPFKAGQG